MRQNSWLPSHATYHFLRSLTELVDSKILTILIAIKNLLHDPSVYAYKVHEIPCAMESYSWDSSWRLLDLQGQQGPKTSWLFLRWCRSSYLRREVVRWLCNNFWGPACDRYVYNTKWQPTAYELSMTEPFLSLLDKLIGFLFGNLCDVY